jgi:hypothetical protein
MKNDKVDPPHCDRDRGVRRHPREAMQRGALGAVAAWRAQWVQRTGQPVAS